MCSSVAVEQTWSPFSHFQTLLKWSSRPKAFPLISCFCATKASKVTRTSWCNWKWCWGSNPGGCFLSLSGLWGRAALLLAATKYSQNTAFNKMLPCSRTYGFFMLVTWNLTSLTIYFLTSPPKYNLHPGYPTLLSTVPQYKSPLGLSQWLCSCPTCDPSLSQPHTFPRGNFASQINLNQPFSFSLHLLSRSHH